MEIAMQVKVCLFESHCVHPILTPSY